MTTGRRRATHVRPRQTPTRVERRPAARPDRRRTYQPRGLDARRRPVPLPARIGLITAVVALGAVVLMSASGGVGTLVSAFGAGLAGALDKIAGSPSPQASIVVATDSPIVVAPAQPYTNQASLELQVVIPADVAGSATAKVRIYLALSTDQAPSAISEVAVGGTTKMQVPVTLTKGTNIFSASIVKGGAESARSLGVTYILDQDPPKITLSSPKDGASVSTDTVDIVGKTQPGSTIVARNEANGTSVTGTAADKDGAFALVLPIVAGPNGIHLTATDPAGNTSDLVVSVQQGTGKLTATLSASIYRISAANHPSSIQFTVLVTDGSGTPVENATAFFTVQLPGLAPVSNQLVTGADGRATFTVPINGTLTVGNGLATVLVTSPSGQTTARVALTVVQ